jgi:hypothetical protein
VTLISTSHEVLVLWPNVPRSHCNWRLSFNDPRRVSHWLMSECVIAYHFKYCYCSVFHVSITALDTNKTVLTLFRHMYETTPTKTSVWQNVFESAPFLEVDVQLSALLNPCVILYHSARAEKVKNFCNSQSYWLELGILVKILFCQLEWALESESFPTRSVSCKTAVGT